MTSNVIAVADGVGGWAESGVDPAKFSRALCKNIAGLCALDEDKYLKTPVDLIVESVETNRETGSSTCVVVSLERDNPILHTANLGDSGYLLLRKTGIDLMSIFRSKE